MEQFGSYVRELQGQLQAVRAEQEADRRQLLELRTLLQQSHHQLDAKEVYRATGRRSVLSAARGAADGDRSDSESDSNVPNTEWQITTSMVDRGYRCIHG